MKLHHFGLWFRYVECDRYNWSTTIPLYTSHIYYDGRLLGIQYRNFILWVYEGRPQIINLKNNFIMNNDGYYDIGRPLTLDDFEIIENPNYKGNI